MSPTKSTAKLSVEDGETKKNNNKSPRSRHLWKKFGITLEQYEDLYRQQLGCCAVCKQHSSAFKYKLAVDHDHITGEIRGLLCYRCNKFQVGRHRKQSSLKLIQATLQYLDRDYTGWVVPPKIKKRRKKHARRKRI